MPHLQNLSVLFHRFLIVAWTFLWKMRMINLTSPIWPGYSEGQFDVFICSHVLEHIPDDRKAMQELYRILKPRGYGIAMVPINLKVEMTLEDPSLQIPSRWKYFAQDDHVRMYAKE